MNQEADSHLPKIVQIIIEAHEGSGGTFTAVRQLARALRPWCNHSIVDFTTRDTAGAGDQITIRAARDWRGRKFSWIDRFERERVRSALQGAHFVFIHMSYRFHAGFAANWCWRHRVPYAFVPHGSFDPYVFTYRAWQKRLWLAAIGRRMLSKAAFLIFATRKESEKAGRTVSNRRGKILPWPTPLPPPCDRNRIRKEVLARYALEPNTRLLVFLGRLDPMKRPAETAAAFRAVAPPGWALVVAGPEEGVPCSAIGGRGRVLAPGGVFGTQKDELLSAADALVLFSHRENFGFSVTEALAHGTPVLISDELDLAPEIAAANGGWIANGRTHEGRMRGISEVTDAARSECASRGLNGRAWVADQLSETRYAANVRSLVEEAIRTDGSPRHRDHRSRPAGSASCASRPTARRWN